MATDVVVPDAVTPEMDTSGIGGHPRGLTTLFFTEMWERFSYYGMRAILILYMVAPVEQGGLGFATVRAASIYGAYTASVYLLGIPGGWVADNVLGARLSVLVGGVFIACGHFSMVFPSMATFYLGLVLISIGTGLLKPNISTMVGGLYGEDDPRRDSGFSIFYMGINLGAFIAPLVCGTLAQSGWFKDALGRMGFHPENSWHWGFAAAGVGMTLGLVQYLAARKRLSKVGNRVSKQKPSEVEDRAQRGFVDSGKRTGVVAILSGLRNLLWAGAIVLMGIVVFLVVRYFSGSPVDINVTGIYVRIMLAFVLSVVAVVLGYLRDLFATGETARAADEAKRLGVIGILFLFSTLFWMAFEQAGSSLNLFADKLTRNSLFGISFPGSWLQSVNSIFIIALAPVFSWLWLRMKDKQPSSPAKFAYGLLFVGLGFLVIAYASSLTASGPVSPMWLVLVYLLHTIGELSLSPVGLSTVTKLAPPRLVGLMMGVWFLSISIGNLVGGWVAGNFNAEAEGALVRLFGTVAATTIVAAAVLAALTPYIRKLMGRVH